MQDALLKYVSSRFNHKMIYRMFNFGEKLFVFDYMYISWKKNLKKKEMIASIKYNAYKKASKNISWNQSII